MKYEYKAVLFCPNDDYPGMSEINNLNNEFEDGWEYVESIRQIVSSAQVGFGKQGSITIILRKEKESVRL